MSKIKFLVGFLGFLLQNSSRTALSHLLKAARVGGSLVLLFPRALVTMGFLFVRVLWVSARILVTIFLWVVQLGRTPERELEKIIQKERMGIARQLDLAAQGEARKRAEARKRITVEMVQQRKKP